MAISQRFPGGHKKSFENYQRCVTWTFSFFISSLSLQLKEQYYYTLLTSKNYNIIIVPNVYMYHKANRLKYYCFKNLTSQMGILVAFT